MINRNIRIERIMKMKLNTQKTQATDYQSILIMAIVAIQIFYAGYKILILLSATIGLDITLLVNPVILFSLGIYVVILYIGISFFRWKTYGWYCETSLYIILLLKNILLFVSGITVLIFKESFLKNIPLPAMKLNSNVLWAIIEFFIAGFMVKQLISTDTINGFNFRNNSRKNIIFKVSVIVILTITLYVGISFLLVAK